MPSPSSCCLHGSLCAVIEHHPWPEPPEGRDMAVKAALKAYRDLARFAINTKEATATGVAVSEPFLFACAVVAAVGELEPYQQDVITYYFLEERGTYHDAKTGQERPCQATNEEVGRLMGGYSAKQIGRWKRQALRRIKHRVYGTDEDEDQD